MKRHIHIGIAALALSLSSCQKEDITPSIDPNAVRVTATVGDDAVTRSNPNGETPESRAQFNSGDAISISADAQDAIVHTLSGTTWSPAGNYLIWETDEMTFNAFYPATEGTSMAAFSLPTDQSTVVNIATADYMTFSGPRKKPSEGNAVSLAFARKTARVIVNIAGFGDEFTGTSTISDLKINSGAATVGGVDIAVITPFVVGTGVKGTSYTALVLPVAANTGADFITLKVGEKTFKLTGIPTHEPATSYTYNLTVGKDFATVGSVVVSDWANGTPITDDVVANFETGTATAGDATNTLDAILKAKFGNEYASGAPLAKVIVRGTINQADFTSLQNVKILDLSAATVVGKVALDSLSVATNQAGNAIPCGAFFDNKVLEVLILPTNITAIGNSAFLKSSLTTITIPESVTAIPDYCFAHCNNLATVSLHAKITTLGEDVFGCSGLTAITIPAGVTAIPASCFYSCRSLTTVNLHDKITTIGDAAFRQSGLTAITIPAGVTAIPDYCFGQCGSLTTVNLHDQITTIGYEAFGYSGLTAITIPAGVTAIPASCFYSCRSLTTVNLHDKITTIGDAAFGGSGLTAITIPAGVTAIPSECFYQCRSLTTVNLHGKITTIGGEAFRQCALTSITIPADVTVIPEWCFYNCSSLTTIEMLGEITSIEFGAFQQCTILSKITCKGATPATIGVSGFEGVEGHAADGVTVYTPSGIEVQNLYTAQWKAHFTEAISFTVAADLSE